MAQVHRVREVPTQPAEQHQQQRGREKRLSHNLPTYSSNARTMPDSRKVFVKPHFRAPFPSQRKKPPPHYAFHYDKTVKGWKETPKETADTARGRWGKAKGALRVGNYFIAVKKKPNTILNIDVKSMVKATLQTRKMNMEMKEAGDGDEDSVQMALTEHTISKPFVRIADDNVEGVWMAPTAVSVERSKQFRWEKPRTERKNLVESASKYQALYLQKVLKQKERETKLITNQLIKTNRDNVALLRELDGYRGKNYDELFKENITLKEQIARACRENAVLAGQLRKSENRILMKFRREKTVM